jgi:HAD superfamily hydrolase (TIGR01509 family)
MQFKAVLFDMDGVLVLSEPLHFQAWQQALEQLAIPADLLSEEDIIGHTDRQIALKVADRSNTRVEESTIFKIKQDNFLSIIKSGLEAVPGRDEFLNYLSDACPVVVISSSGRREIEAVLKQEKIIDKFEFFVGFEDTQEHKPHPAPYLLALEKLKLRPQDCLIVEDSPSGSKAAKAAGCSVAGVNTSGSLSENMGIPLFDDHHEILQWVRS